MSPSIPVFYTPAQVAVTTSMSPSAAKPAKVVASWQARGLPIRIVAPQPVTIDDFALAHDRTFVEDVFAGRCDNGFGNRSAQVAAALPWTTGSMLSAARHALAHGGVAAAPCSGFHHAGYDQPSGFCTFNGLVVTALKLRAEARAAKVGILDCDQHYGDGTDALIGRHRATGWIRHVTAGQQYPRDAAKFLAMLPRLVRGVRGVRRAALPGGRGPARRRSAGRVPGRRAARPARCDRLRGGARVGPAGGVESRGRIPGRRCAACSTSTTAR